MLCDYNDHEAAQTSGGAESLEPSVLASPSGFSGRVFGGSRGVSVVQSGGDNAAWQHDGISTTALVVVHPWLPSST